MLQLQQRKTKIYDVFKKNAGVGGGRCVATYDQRVARWALISDRTLVSHQLPPPSINQSTKPNRHPQLTNPQVQQVLKANS